MSASLQPDETERRWVLAALALVLVTVSTFLSSVGGDFVNYDDWTYVFDKRTLEGLTTTNVVRAFTEILSGNWHPLTWLSHMLDVQLFGVNPAGHHVGNIVLHAVNVVLVLVLLRRLGASLLTATLLTLVFAVHPLRVESVAWISERKDVLCATFYLGTMVLWASPSRRMPGVIACMILAFLSKPMAVSLPVVMALHDWLVLRKPMTAVVRGTFGFFVLAAGLAGMTIVAQRHGMQSAELIPLPLRLQSALVTPIFYYLKATIRPDCLHIIYTYPEAWPIWKVVVAGVATSAFLAVAANQRTRRPLVTLGILWYFISLIPVTGIVMVGIAVAADRYTYLPSVGLLVLLIPAAEAVLASRYRLVVSVVTSVFALSLALASQPQIATWSSTEALIDAGLVCEPDNPDLLEASASLDIEEGYLDAAVYKLEKATTVRPGLISSWMMWASVATMRRDWVEARRLWLEVLSWDAQRSIGHFGLSLALSGLGERDAATSEFELGLRTSMPTTAHLKTVMAGYVQLGETARAEQLRLILKRGDDAALWFSPSQYHAR